MSIEIGCFRTSLYTHPWTKASQFAIAGLRAARECRYSYQRSSKNVGKDADVAAWKAALRIDPEKSAAFRHLFIPIQRPNLKNRVSATLDKPARGPAADQRVRPTISAGARENQAALGRSACATSRLNTCEKVR
jgi:hypothetical protein